MSIATSQITLSAECSCLFSWYKYLVHTEPLCYFLVCFWQLSAWVLAVTTSTVPLAGLQDTVHPVGSVSDPTFPFADVFDTETFAIRGGGAAATEHGFSCFPPPCMMQCSTPCAAGVGPFFFTLRLLQAAWQRSRIATPLQLLSVRCNFRSRQLLFGGHPPLPPHRQTHFVQP